MQIENYPVVKSKFSFFLTTGRTIMFPSRPICGLFKAGLDINLDINVAKLKSDLNGPESLNSWQGMLGSGLDYGSDDDTDGDGPLSNLGRWSGTAGYRAKVNKEGADIARGATEAYLELAKYLFVKCMDGNLKKTDENGNFIKSEYGLPVYPSFPGYDKKYYENIVKESGDHFLIKE